MPELYNGAFTGPEIDALLAQVGPLSEKVTQRVPMYGKGVNLLDNWYFGNADAIVDQRGGYVVPPTAQWYSDGDTGLTTPRGQVGYWASVVERKSTYARCMAGDGVSYFLVAIGDTVRGYTGAGYGIDRWVMTAGTVVVTDHGLTLIANGNIHSDFYEVLENTQIKGETVTFSALLDGKLINGSAKYPGDAGAASVVYDDGSVALILRVMGTGLPAVSIWVYEGSSPTIVAAKLELGAEQTLARQNESGAWVLNDPPPNYQQELAKCMRYQVAIPFMIGTALSTAISDASGEAWFPLSLPVSPRANGAFYLMSGQLRVHGMDVDYFNVSPGSRALVQGNIANINVSGLNNLTAYTLDAYPGGKFLLDFNL